MSNQEALPGLGNQSEIYIPPLEDLVSPKDMARIILNSRSGSKREAYRKSDAQKTKPKEPSKLSLASRLQVSHLHDELGFLPTSRVETTQALRLMQDLGKPYSTTRYLREIQKRQSKKGVDIISPERTVLNVVRAFAGHATDARITSIVLRSLLDKSVESNPQLLVNEVDEIPLDHLVPLKRHFDLNVAIGSAPMSADNYEDVGNALDTDLMGKELDLDSNNALEEYAATLSVSGARMIAKSILVQQPLREQFWTDRVGEARAFPPARHSVDRATGVYQPAVY